MPKKTRINENNWKNYQGALISTNFKEEDKSLELEYTLNEIESTSDSPLLSALGLKRPLPSGRG